MDLMEKIEFIIYNKRKKSEVVWSCPEDGWRQTATRGSTVGIEHCKVESCKVKEKLER